VYQIPNSYGYVNHAFIVFIFIKYDVLLSEKNKTHIVSNHNFINFKHLNTVDVMTLIHCDLILNLHMVISNISIGISTRAASFNYFRNQLIDANNPDYNHLFKSVSKNLSMT